MPANNINNAKGDSVTFTQNMDQYKAKNPGLSVSDIQRYNINKSNYFAGTIAVCVIYGVFSLVLLLLTVFSPAGSQLLTDTFRTFTITFIIGMILAIILLTIMVVSYKPKKLSANPYDAQMCPDYWSLEETSITSDNYIHASLTNQSLMDYTCKNKRQLGKYNSVPTGLDATTINPQDTKSLYNEYNLSVNNTSANAVKSDASDPKDINKNVLDCKNVFPLVLNSVNSTNPQLNNIPNALACRYAEQCGVSWTAMCPSGPTNIS